MEGITVRFYGQRKVTNVPVRSCSKTGVSQPDLRTLFARFLLGHCYASFRCFIQNRWLSLLQLTVLSRSRNRCVFESSWWLFWCCHVALWFFSVAVGALVKGQSRISSFFSQCPFQNNRGVRGWPPYIRGPLTRIRNYPIFYYLTENS